MNAFRRLLPLLLFAAVLVATDRALTPLLGRLYAGTRTGILAGQANLALAHRDADVVVFGSSRAVTDVDPGVLEAALGLSAHNAGNRGQGVRYARGLEAVMLARGSRAKAFVLLVDANDLWDDSSVRLQALAPFWGESAALDSALAARDTFARWKLRSGLYRYNSLLISMLAHRLRPAQEDGNGFLPLPPREGPLVPLGVVDEPVTAPPVHEALASYRDFIRDARAAGKAVLLVTAPRWRPDGLSAKQREGRRLLRALAEAEEAVYVAIDQTTCPDFGDEALWWDVSHLMPEGARRYSTLLAEAVAAALAED